MKRFSVNEISAITKKAAVGAGIPYGVAEDCADYTVWLTLSGLDGVSVFCGAGQRWVQGRSATIEFSPNANAIVSTDPSLSASSLFAAPSLSDQLLVQMKSSTGQPIMVAQVDEPLLLLASVVLTSEGVNQCWMMDWGAGDSNASVQAQCEAGICKIWASQNKSVFRPGPTDVTIQPTAQEPENQKPIITTSPPLANNHDYYQQGVYVGAKEQEFLEGYMARTWVPSSEGSRLRGAGAGLTDND